MKYLLFGLCIASFCISCQEMGSRAPKNFKKQHEVLELSEISRTKSRSFDLEESDSDRFEVERVEKDQPYAKHSEKQAHQLTYDLYAPKNEETDRPLIVFLHPGAFITGSKEHDLIQGFAQDFAAQGYVSIAANYRLAHYSGGIGGLLEELLDIGKLAKKNVYRSLQDVHTLMAFCQSHAEAWGIDPDRIYLVGYSAGAVLALNYAYMDQREAFEFFEHEPDNCLECLPYITETDKPERPVKIRGVAAIAGGVFDLEHVDTESPIPTLLIHGDQDDIVPMNEGDPFSKYHKDYNFTFGDVEFNISTELSKSLLNFLSLPMNGSQKIYEKSTKNVRFVELTNKGHEYSSSGPEYPFLFKEIESFLKTVDGRR